MFLPHGLDLTLEGCEGKLWRAKQHLEVFRDEVTTFTDADSHTITVEDDPNTNEYIFKVSGLRATDPDWAYIVGDCVHNLRTVLDHLVYQLARLGLGRDLTNEEARGCSFPIYTDPEGFARRGKDRIKFLRSGEQTRIAELQPFNAADRSIWPQPIQRGPIISSFGIFAPVPSLLGGLADLDNLDKHRSVQPTWRTVSWQDAVTVEKPIRVVGSTTSAGALEDDAEVGRWHYMPPRPELPADMDMNIYFPLGVSLGEPPQLDSAIGILDGLTASVEIVLALFKPCITDGAPALPIAAIQT